LKSYLFIALIGALICLDRSSVQSLVSRPIVAAPLLGFLLGDPLTGLAVGAFAELIWIDQVSIGGFVPCHDTLVAVLITGGLITSFGPAGSIAPPQIAFGFLVFIPLAYLGRRLEISLIGLNGRLADRAKEAVAGYDFRKIDLWHLLCILVYYLSFSLLIFLALAFFGEIVTLAYPELPPPLIMALKITYFILPLLGAAVAVTVIREQPFLLYGVIFLGVLLLFFVKR